jgi:hypothetical protein
MSKKGWALVGLPILWVMAVAPVAPALGQGNSNQAKEKKEKKEHSQDKGESGISVDFKIDFNSKDAQRWAKEYGLSGQKPLPPGIRKNLARGKPLPPGIAKRDLSGPFVGKLPSHPDYVWQMAGTDLVLTSKADKRVREIVRDVFK